MTTTTLTKGSDVVTAVLGALLVRGRPKYGDPLAAFDPLTEGIRSYHDAGNSTNMRASPAILAARVRPLGRYETAATIAGFARSIPSPRRRSHTRHRDRR
jgi:hypothetical protein